MLQISDISYEYPDISLFQKVRFTVNLGTALHIQGKNGRGKTTLLKLIAGFIRPTHGKILYQNQNIFEDIQSYQTQIHFVGHKLGISRELTIRQMLAYEYHVKSNEALALLNSFNLSHLLETQIKQLSQGQKKRLSFIRCLITQKPIWLLDEPFASIDTEGKAMMFYHFNKHMQNGGCIILTTHEPLIDTGLSFNIYQL